MQAAARTLARRVTRASVARTAANSAILCDRGLSTISRGVVASLPHVVAATSATDSNRRAPSRRMMSTAESDPVVGREALAKARVFIDEDNLADAMKYLNIAAHHDVAEAQYLLGSLLEKEPEEDDDENDNAELVSDAETKRKQLANDEDEPQDLKSIRKRARKAYKAYLLSKAAKLATGERATGRMAQVVQRATKEELDRAFGVTLKSLLDPKAKLRPLSSLAKEEMENAKQGGDSTQAIEWLRRAASNGHRDAHVYLGNLCLEQDPPLAQEALQWYFHVTPPRVEKDPHPDALFNIGMILYDGVDNAEPPVEANRVASIPYFVRAAEAGDASAQFFMGQLLFSGDEELEIEPNPTSAMMLIERAAELDHSGAQYYLAQLYRSGDEDNSIPADREKFLHYLDRAIEGDDEEALFCMADIYFHGSDGFEKDLDQARLFYEAAAEAGSADAFCCLGALYYNGTGVPKDYKKAFLYYQEAADRDSMEAWKNLADMYYIGRGVPKNEATAESILKMLQKMEAEE